MKKRKDNKTKRGGSMKKRKDNKTKNRIKKLYIGISNKMFEDIGKFIMKQKVPVSKSHFIRKIIGDVIYK